MRVTLRRLVPALAVSVALVSGCAAKEDADTASSTAGDASEATSASEAPDEPGADTVVGEFPGDTEPDTAEPSADARVTVSEVRLAAQDGFDRVVFELGGVGTPGWDVRYVPEASEPGSGAAVPLEGGAVLQVGITGAGYPYDTGVEEFTSAQPLTAADTRSVTEVAFRATFEGTTTAFIGARDQAPFRVYLLQDPVRVVVEVAHGG